MLIYLSVIVLMTFFSNFGDHLDPMERFYELFYFYLVVVMLGVFTYSVHHALKLLDSVKKRLYTDKLSNQLDIQLSHYEVYQKYMTEFAGFKHDYKNILQTMHILLSSGKYDEAKGFLNDLSNEKMPDSLAEIQETSNSFVVDAIMHHYKYKCQQNDISLEVGLKFPNSISFSQLELMKIFTNIMDNAFEANMRIDNQPRYIHILTSNITNWLLITVKNPFKERIKPIVHGIKSVKDDQILHGHGVRIIKGIVESHGGLVNFSVDNESKVFTFQMLLPK